MQRLTFDLDSAGWASRIVGAGVKADRHSATDARLVESSWRHTVGVAIPARALPIGLCARHRLVKRLTGGHRAGFELAREADTARNGPGREDG